jgi:hypothetical protein
MPDRPLADSQKKILLVLLDAPEGLTCNTIAREMGYDHGMRGDRYSHTGKRMGPANRIIPAILGLRKRGLTRMGYDGFHYPEYLTSEGHRVAAKLAGRGVRHG